jgi:hypothetical protein
MMALDPASEVARVRVEIKAEGDGMIFVFPAARRPGLIRNQSRTVPGYNLESRRLDALICIGDRKLDPAPAPAGQHPQ